MLGGPGQTARGRSPTFDSIITAPPSQATIQSVSVALPASVGIKVSALKRACQTAQYVAGSCPENSEIGTGTATTPLLATPLTGPVVLALTPGSVVPSLVVELRGPLPVTLVGAVAFVAGRPVNTFTNVPDVPISSFELRINGGKDGLLINNKNRCTAGSRVGLVLTAHNGKTLRRQIPAEVRGCRPAGP